MPLHLMYFPALFPSMQENRRAAKAVVGRLAHGAGRVVKAVRAAPAGRGATGMKSTEGLFGLVPAESAPCLSGVSGTTSAEPRWLDAGVGTRAYLDLCAVGGETIFLWCVWCLLMLVLLSVWWLPSCP